MAKILDKKYKPVRLQDFDTSVRPADDFYQFVNGNWLKKTKIPPTESRWGSFYILHDNNRKQLKVLMKDIVSNKNAPKGSDVQKMRDLYLSSMDARKRNKNRLSPLSEMTDMIRSLSSKEKLTSVIADLHMIGVGVFWDIYVDQDDKNSEKMVLRFHQDGLGMPDRDYYVKDDADSKRVRSAYQKHIVATLKLAGYSLAKARVACKDIMNIETRLARASMTRVERRNIKSQYNVKTIKELERLAPAIDWRKYLKIIDTPKLQTIIVDQPLFLKEVDKLLRSSSLSKLEMYLHWHLVSGYASTLSDDFVDASFNFYGKVISGIPKLQPRWKRSLGAVSGGMGFALGRVYIKKYFPPSSKRKMNSLVKDLLISYNARITELDWMSAPTKKKAKAKLKTVVSKIGYPDKKRSYKKLQIQEDSYTQNVMRVSEFHFDREINKLGKPVDRNEWNFTPATVNACYSPNQNYIEFPAGILQPPFFNLTADDAINYGSIGAIIGHELTHGFDDQGAQFDSKGNFRNWWSVLDKKKFDAKGKKVIQQFNAFTVVGGLHVNGKLTLGENIADLGGLVIAYHALKKHLKKSKRVKIDGFTPEERFFISAAIVDRGIYRDEFIKMKVKNDPHSPAKYRVNGPLSNMVEFYETFGVKKGNKMYRSPKSRVVIW